MIFLYVYVQNLKESLVVHNRNVVQSELLALSMLRIQKYISWPGLSKLIHSLQEYLQFVI